MFYQRITVAYFLGAGLPMSSPRGLARVSSGAGGPTEPPLIGEESRRVRAAAHGSYACGVCGIDSSPRAEQGV